MTIRAHGKAWNEFTGWCRSRGLKPIPAHAWTVAAYVRWCEPRRDFQAIVDSLKAIARRHLIAGHPDPERDPMVRRTVAMMERRIANRHQRSSLFEEDFPVEKTEPVVVEAKPEPARKRQTKTMRATPKLVRRRQR